MPFFFKGNQETNPHLWSLSYFLQNSSSSNTKVKMDDIDEQLKINIRSILTTIPEETVNGIIQAVKYAGLETLSDLQFVQEEDLILVLNPIQRRKLIKAWSGQSIPAVKLLKHVPLKKCKWKKQKRLVLLQVYAKYKKEFTCPDIEKHEVWRKIADEVQQRCSSNCDELQCMDKIEQLKSEYERLKKNNVITKKNSGFFFEAQSAFENIESSDILNSQVKETKQVAKYVPPHLRNGRNKSESVTISKIEDKPFTIKVSNLSKDVKESDLQELFIPFGKIARIYTIKNALCQSKGFAFIKFHKTEDATRAIEAVNGIEYNKLILKVEWAPKFNMNDFKKVYSNEEKSVSIKYFWDNFDAENYSIWFCEYLYPDQLTLTFRSYNLIEGMFQRLYSMQSTAFASVCLFGEDYNSTISGIWVWKGHELAFTLSPDWQVDYEAYSWKKLDPSSEETKKLVNEYFTWSGEFGGKKFIQGKIFK